MPKNDPEYERGFTDGFNAGSTGIKATSDAEQLIELRKQYRTAMFALKETAFSYHVEAEHKAAFSACTNVMCAQACRMFNAYPTVTNPF